MTSDHTPTPGTGSPDPVPPTPRVPDFPRGLAALFLADWKPSRRFGIAAAVLVAMSLVIAGLALHGFAIGDPDRWFHEGKWATVLSALMLGVAAFFAFREAEWYPDRSARPVWIGLGVLLAIAGIDEAFKLHEHIDIWIHQILGMDRDGPWSSLDSYLVLAYPLAMAVLTLRHWRHVLAMRSFLRWLAVGGGAFVVMAAADIHLIHLPTPPDGDILWEELAKSLAVICILAGVLNAQPRFRGRRPKRLLARWS